MVMRSTGKRPQARHVSFDAAQDEARRIAANSPGTDVWVIECQTVETVSTPLLACL
jgi:hypothetical protein